MPTPKLHPPAQICDACHPSIGSSVKLMSLCAIGQAGRGRLRQERVLRGNRGRQGRRAAVGGEIALAVDFGEGVDDRRIEVAAALGLTMAAIGAVASRRPAINPPATTTTTA